MRGKIKWYVTPIVFGGNPALKDNIIWVTLAEHTELVQWWNRKYRELASGVGWGNSEVRERNQFV